MIRLPFFSLAHGSQFLGADAGLECATLWHDGATLWLVMGGQTGGWASRERVWVHDRLPGGPQQDKAYSGYWANNSIPTTALPQNLTIAEATLTATSEGFPLARVPSNTAFTAQFAPFSGISWHLQLLSASSGAILFDSGLTNSSSFSIPALPSGTSAILRAHAKATPAIYSWPPPQYQSISGESSATPTQFAWTHPTRGTLYYDPRYRVGARPYDRSDPIQAALLDGEAAAIADKTARKIPDWVPYLFEFNADGSPVADDGEWSMLRVVSGLGVWAGDSAVHAAATTPALWRMPLDTTTMKPSGALAPWVIDPTLRAVGALEVGGDGSLYVGGAVAGQSGPMPAIYQIQTPTDSGGDAATTEATLSLFICECCEPMGKAIRGIAQTQSGLRAVSPCDSFRRDENATLFRRLIPAHPGGRNALTLRHAHSEDYVFSTEGGDFAISAHHQVSHGYLVIESGSGQKRTGAPLAKQLDSCLATLGDRLFGIEEWNDEGDLPYFQTLAERLASYQALGTSLDGAQWERLLAWQVGDFDAGPVARAGSKRDGAALFAFGTTGEAALMRGRCLRLQGQTATRGIDCDFFMQRANTARHGGEDWMVGVGLKRGQESFDREQFVLLSKGEPARVVLPWTGGGYCAGIDEWLEWGFDPNNLPPYLIWTGTCWMASQTPPTDGSPYLTRTISETTVCYVSVCSD